MTDSHKRFQEAFDELFKLTLTDKHKFFEALLFYTTISGRAIWSDDKTTDTEKVKAFKWLNELVHRIWNIKYELSQGEDHDTIKRLYENMKLYGERSTLLREHLVPTLLGALDNFKVRK
jgi:hypothetical protein